MTKSDFLTAIDGIDANFRVAMFRGEIWVGRAVMALLATGEPVTVASIQAAL